MYLILLCKVEHSIFLSYVFFSFLFINLSLLSVFSDLQVIYHYSFYNIFSHYGIMFYVLLNTFMRGDFLKSIMLKFLSAILTFVYIFSPGTVFAEKPEVAAHAAILIDADTGQILYEKNAHESMYPASTTKILTCIIALEESELDEKVIVDDKTPIEVWGGHIALEAGEEFTMDQLLNGLMLNSANDTGMAIARHISGSIEGFADLMNKRAKEMGALNSNFRNPHGLPDEEHTTTAYDLAFIAKYAMKNEQFRSYVSKVEDTIPETNKKDEPRYLINSNKMLYSDMEYDIDGVPTPVKYEGITGIKTGYTDAAMQCLVSSLKEEIRSI